MKHHLTLFLVLVLMGGRFFASAANVGTDATQETSATIGGQLSYDGDQEGPVRVSVVSFWGSDTRDASLDELGSYAVSNVTVGTEDPASELGNDSLLPVGQGFLAFNNQTVTQEVMLIGELPWEAFTDVTVYPGLNLLGYPYAVDIPWEETTLAQTCVNGSWMCLWDATSSQFAAHLKLCGKWVPSGATLSTGLGFAFFNPSGVSTNWREECPYSDALGAGEALSAAGNLYSTATQQGKYLLSASRSLREPFVPVAVFDALPDQHALASYVATNTVLKETEGTCYLHISTLVSETDDTDGATVLSDIVSGNVVGYMRKIMAPESRALLTPVFQYIGGVPYTVAQLMGGNLTGAETPLTADHLQLFDASSQSAMFLWKDAETNWWSWKRRTGHYGVFAYRDSNRNNLLDEHEATGEYAAVPLHVAGDVSGVDVRLTDPDGDSDGMPDWWEAKHSLNLSTNDAATDSDSDGFSNLAEYIAGTSPTNDAESLRIVSCGPVQDKLGAYAVAWDTVTGRFYSVLSTTNLGVPWSNTTPAYVDVPGDGFRTVYTNNVSEGAVRFYRITVDRLPVSQ